VTVHDDDILDYDFVDDETRELPPPSRPRARGRPEARPAGAAGGRGAPPRTERDHALLRLAALVALAILVVVLLAVWVQGCAAEDDQVTYSDYMAEVDAVGKDSQDRRRPRHAPDDAGPRPDGARTQLGGCSSSRLDAAGA
jgi:hypothetical protein